VDGKPAQGSDALSAREQAVESREEAAATVEATLRVMDQALQERVEALEARGAELLDREAKLGLREEQARLREDTMRLVDLAKAELETQNGELRQANEKLVMATLVAQELREAAQLAHRRQEEFLAMLSHELRNPLAPIRNAVELLSRLNGKPVPSNVLGIVRRQVEHMVRLVDDLLDVSRVTQGKVTLQRRPTAVTEFVDQAVESCRALIAVRKQHLTLELPPVAIFVDGDPVRLAQIFNNLLQNAVKYTAEGGAIDIRAHSLGDRVEIQVRDDGMGISAEALPHVFDLFAQDERALDRAQGGLGIGLTVVQRMVELHGGAVFAHSDGRGMGSRFVVTLPCVDGMTKPDQTRAVAGLAPALARVLLVEDNVDAAETLADLLRLSGHEVDIAFDGTSGLDLFESIKPQVVLCDIGLPGIDGYEVVRRMRKSRHDPRPALIAVTGYGSSQDATRALDAGFDHHVVKPIDPEAILRLIDSALRIEDWSPSKLGAITTHGSLTDIDRRRRTG